MDKGVDPDKVSTNSWWTPLIAAAYYGKKDVVALLLNRGADPNIVDHVGNTPIIYASCNGFNDIIKELLDRGVDVNQPNHKGLTPLISAVKKGHVNTASFLLSMGADSTAENKRGKTALGYAVYKRYEKVVDLLLSDKNRAKTIINQEDAGGNTPLHFSIRVKNFNLFKKLISHGADMHHVSKAKHTPLMKAAEQGDIAVVRFILENTSSSPSLVNFVDGRGDSALFLAARAKQTDIVKLLLLYDAENFSEPNSVLNRKNNNSQTLFDIVSKSNDPLMINLLGGWEKERKNLRHEFIEAQRKKLRKQQAIQRHKMRDYINRRKGLG